jgi:WD40 repeat protein
MPDYKSEQIKPAWKLSFDVAGQWPTAVALLGSHQKVAAANQDGTIMIWELSEKPVATKIKLDNGKEEDGFETPPPARRLVGHTNGVTRLIATPDGQTLISASLDRTVRVWNIAASLEGESEIVLDADRRSQRARNSSKQKREEILQASGVKVPTQTQSTVLAGHNDWVNALAISGDGKRIISGDDSRLAIVWDIASRQEVSRWRCSGVAWIVSAALSPDGQTALVSQYRRRGGEYNSYPSFLRLYNVADGAVKLDILATNYPKEKNPPYAYQYEYSKFVGQGLVATAFSPDGQLLACAQGGEEGDGKCHILEVATGKELRTIGGHQYGTTDLCFSRDGKLLFTAGRDTQFRILQVEDGKEIAKAGKPRGGQFTDWLSAISLSPDELWLAAADISGHVQIWELVT